MNTRTVVFLIPLQRGLTVMVGYYTVWFISNLPAKLVFALRACLANKSPAGAGRVEPTIKSALMPPSSGPFRVAARAHPETDMGIYGMMRIARHLFQPLGLIYRLPQCKLT